MSYEEVLESVSLVLLNTHFSLNPPRPYVPNMIEVGGMHVNRNKGELPEVIICIFSPYSLHYLKLCFRKLKIFWIQPQKV